MIQVKRIYNQSQKKEGYRILVDRLWPRGVSKYKAKVDLWLRDIAPSEGLRKWFSHDPAKWKDFQIQYTKELKQRPGPLNLIEQIEKEKGVKLSHTDLLLALTSRVLVKHPKMNASWAGNGIKKNPAVNIGMAVAVPDGVVSAVIPNSGTASLAEVAVQRRDLAERAKANKLKPNDLSGGTFTISNLGMYGIDQFNAIIVTPQAAILAVGRISDRVVPVDGKPGIRPMFTVTLSSDHRVVDGAQAALFLNDLAEAVREPQKWL